MKSFLIIVSLLYTIVLPAQTKLIPGKNVVEKKWLNSQEYQMTWYAIKDTTRFEVGKTSTQISNDGKKIVVVTRVSINQSKTPWIDSTIANADDLRPVYHSSYNAQRDMVLHFGKIVTGYFKDKKKNIITLISDTTTETYFDSNIYPTLITWLSLKEGYGQNISIYDYTPGSKSGTIQATVQLVKKGVFKSKKSGNRTVWVVTVTDEIGGGQKGSYTYYIDVEDRRLWKEEIDLHGNKMEMELVEQ